MTSAGQSFSVGLDDLGGDGREDNEKRGHGLQVLMERGIMKGLVETEGGLWDGRIFQLYYCLANNMFYTTCSSTLKIVIESQNTPRHLLMGYLCLSAILPAHSKIFSSNPYLASQKPQGAFSGPGYRLFSWEMLRTNIEVVQQVSTIQNCANYPIIKKQNMREPPHSPTSKRKYSKISLQKRLNLVRLVSQEGQPVTKAAKKLCIKLCTARIILKKYKQTGRFPMKSTRRNPPLPSHSAPSVQQASSPSPAVAQPQGEVFGIDGSFKGCHQNPKEESIFFPLWVQWQSYYAMVASQTMLYSF